MSAETKPHRVPHHTLVRLRVTGGILSGAQLDFADGLNCFIGGRGAGKTTALEFLRFGLGLMRSDCEALAERTGFDDERARKIIDSSRSGAIMRGSRLCRGFAQARENRASAC